MMRTIRRSETIRETSRGWCRLEYGRYYKTAAGAFLAIDRQDKRIADSAPVLTAVMTTLTWEPTTRIGEMVVRAITGK